MADIVAIPSGSGSNIIALPPVIIYAIVDVSASMRGAKIEAVCEELKSMFNSWPETTTLNLRVFATLTNTIVTGPKSSIDIDAIIKTIKRCCDRGGATALYDAWGDALTTMPDSADIGRRTQVFVITDGEDNMSKRHTLNTVRELTVRRKANGVQFTFIEVGRHTATRAMQSIRGIREITAMRVDDNAVAIRRALRSVNNGILSQLEIPVQSSRVLELTNEPRLELPPPPSNRLPFIVNKSKYLPKKK